MFNAIIRFSLNHRLLIVSLSLLLLFVGGYRATQLPIDVLPDLNRPRVTVITECPGMAPEEVEMLVTMPLEAAINGATGIEAVRSNSTVGLSIITIEFDWDVETYRSRQIVSERLQLAQEQMPEGVVARMTPIASVMGQIVLLSVWDDGYVNERGELKVMTPMQVRTLAEWVIRRRLLGIGGISEMYVMGGERRQFQVQVNPEELLKYDLTIADVEDALRLSNRNVTGGYLTEQGADQFLVRSLGRIRTVDDLKNLVIDPQTDPPVLLEKVASVVEAPSVPVGSSSTFTREKDGTVRGGESVVMTIEKQPDQDTRRLTEQILAEVGQIQESLRSEFPGLRIECSYQQRTFIDLAIDNVKEALYFGAFLIVVVLALFLMNLRATFITLLAMPISIIVTCLIFAWFGLSINTMTLGGLAVAIGELVDDAIVDVENIFRRLRLYFRDGGDESPGKIKHVVYEASREIRNSIVFGTMITVMVFFPLFFLTGIEGRLFAPLGVAYVVSILSSLIVSLTLTPVLAWLLLPGVARKHRDREGPILRSVQYIAEIAIRFSLAFPKTVLILATALTVFTGIVFFSLERNFMPPFNEGALQLNVDLMPGKSLQTSTELAENLARQVVEVPGIQCVVRKTGRSELDEHAVPVNTSEFICTLDPESGRSLEEVLDDVVHLIDPSNIPGTIAFHDQPLQHLINHLRAGTRARIAVKLRGDDFEVLRRRAKRVKELIEPIEGIGNVRLDPIPIDIPQVRITLDRNQLALHGLRPDEVNTMIETAMNGSIVTEVLENQISIDVVVRLADEYRENLQALERLPVQIPGGGIVPLRTLATIDPKAMGPSQIDREAGRRQILIQTNPRNRGAVDVKEDIDRILAPYMDELTSNQYHLELAGLFQSEQEASRRIGALTLVSLFGIFLALFTMFRSTNLALQIMIALPMALIGGVAAIVLTGQDRTIPNLVGMISLCGIAARNGILLIDHYLHLVQFEGETLSKEMLIKAGRHRVAPVLMTTLTSAIGLIPLTLTPGEPGREILYPIATVVVGGLLSSTIMEFFVRPALFWTFGLKAAEQTIRLRREDAIEKEARLGAFREETLPN